MIRWAFVTTSGLMQQITNRVRDEHASFESCCKSSDDDCFRRFAGSYFAQRPRATELVP
jgi:hypothetical protein